MKIGKEIVLKNATKSFVNSNIGKNGNVDIEDVVIFEPGTLVPVVLEQERTVGSYAKILSVTITELKTHVVFEFVKVSKDIADAAYKIYTMTHDISSVGSYRAKSTSDRRSEYSLNDRDDDDDDDDDRNSGFRLSNFW